MYCRVEKEIQMELGFALQGKLILLCSRGFLPVVVHTDLQNAYKAPTAAFPVTVIDVRGALSGRQMLRFGASRKYAEE
jgi:hypothetical protein